MSARTTINIGGVPPDVTQEQFTRWFLFAVGFDGCSISTAAGGPIEATATFSSTEAAEWAIKVLNGRQLQSVASGGVVQLSAWLPQEEEEQERVVHVRFKEASAAKVAVECLNGTTIQDLTIAARLDPDWADQTQLIVTGVGTSVSDAELREYFSAAGEVVQCGAPAMRTSIMVIRNLSVVEQEVQAAVGRMEGFLSLHYEVSAGKAVAIVRFGSEDACAKALEVLRESAFPSTPSEPIECDFLQDGEARPDGSAQKAAPPRMAFPLPAVRPKAAAPAAPTAPAAPAAASGPGRPAPNSMLVATGLPATCTEHEVALFFRKSFAGFVWLKLVRMAMETVTYVKFVTADHAAAALQLMNVGGVTFPNHDGALNADFAPTEWETGSSLRDPRAQQGVIDQTRQGSTVLIYRDGEPRMLRWESKEQAVAELVSLGMLDRLVAVSLLSIDEEDAKEIVSSLGPEVKDSCTFIRLALALRAKM